MAWEINKRTINIIVGLIILLILIFLFGNKNFRSVLLLGEKIDNLRAEINKLKAENAMLKKELQQIKENPEYFEDLARKRLGMIKPGETKYKLVSPENLPDEKPR